MAGLHSVRMDPVRRVAKTDGLAEDIRHLAKATALCGKQHSRTAFCVTDAYHLEQPERVLFAICSCKLVLVALIII